MTALGRHFARDPRLWLATTVGVGFFPKAPGTAASFVAVVIWWFLLSEYRGLVQLAVIAGVSIIAYWAVESIQKRYQVDDHQAITVDEVIGQWVAMIALPQSLLLACLAFLFFRVLDIWKPYPVLWSQEELPGAFGVIGDDVVAGLIVCAVFHFFFSLLDLPAPDFDTFFPS